MLRPNDADLTKIFLTFCCRRGVRNFSLDRRDLAFAYLRGIARLRTPAVSPATAAGFAASGCRAVPPAKAAAPTMTATAASL